MTTTDLIHLSAASAIVGAASVCLIYIVAILIRDARARREHRRNNVEGRTILHRI